MNYFESRFAYLFSRAVALLGYDEAIEITELILNIFDTSVDYEVARSGKAVKEEP